MLLALLQHVLSLVTGGTLHEATVCLTVVYIMRHIPNVGKMYNYVAILHNMLTDNFTEMCGQNVIVCCLIL